MSRLSPETDRLMWALAESDNTTAVEEFCERFPEHRPEMMKRLRVVTGIKGAKVSAKPKVEVPKFLPPVRPAAPNTRLQWATAGICALALVVVATAVMIKPSGREAAKPLGDQRIARQEAVAPEPTRPQPIVIKANRLPGPDSVSRPPNDTVKTNKDSETAALRPKDVQLSGVNLREAILLITDGSGLKVELAPGFPEPEVSIEYTARTTLEILADLGSKYGFSVLDEGDSHLLLVPATEESRGSNRRIGG